MKILDTNSAITQTKVTFANSTPSHPKPLVDAKFVDAHTKSTNADIHPARADAKSAKADVKPTVAGMKSTNGHAKFPSAYVKSANTGAKSTRADTNFPSADAKPQVNKPTPSAPFSKSTPVTTVTVTKTVVVETHTTVYKARR